MSFFFGASSSVLWENFELCSVKSSGFQTNLLPWGNSHLSHMLFLICLIKLSFDVGYNFTCGPDIEKLSGSSSLGLKGSINLWY